jgi:hypothetical protein
MAGPSRSTDGPGTGFHSVAVRTTSYLGADYVARLRASGSAELVKAWLEGDWSVIEGAFFDCWDTARHVLRPFEIPPDWTRFRSGDWGSAKPFSFGWWAVVGDKLQTESFHISSCSQPSIARAHDGGRRKLGQ